MAAERLSILLRNQQHFVFVSTQRPARQRRRHTSLPSDHKKSLEAARRGVVSRVASVSEPLAGKSWSREDVERAKSRLLMRCDGVERGATADSERRGEIEEGVVDLEKFGGAPLSSGLALLDGLWELQYSTAPDVAGIVRAPSVLPLPIIQVGKIFQRFTCQGKSDGGFVDNIVQWSVPGLLQDNDGATLTVSASFAVRSQRSIELRFERAALGDVRISGPLQDLLAPAFLPRTQLSLDALQLLRGLNIALPITPPDVPNRPTAGNRFMLTFLDETMLVGRATVTGGLFIFKRSQE